MRKILFWNLFVILTLFGVSNLNSQWIDKGEYKEIIVSDKAIKQILTPEGQDYFYVVDAGNLLYKYSYNGELIQKKGISFPGYSFQRCSNDGRSLIFIARKDTTFIDGSLDWDSTTYLITVIKIENDTTIYNEVLSIDKNPPYAWNHTTPIYFDFSMEEMILLTIVDISNSNSSGYYSKTGSVNFLSIDSGKIHYYSVGYKPIVRIDKNHKCILSVGGFDEGDYKGTSWLESNSFRLRLLEKESPIILSYHGVGEGNHAYTKKGYGYIPEDIQLGNTNNIFASTRKDTLRIYTFSADTFNLLDSTIMIGYKPLNMLFTPNDEFLIFSSPNKSVDIFDYRKSSIIKTYNLLDTANNSIIKIDKTNSGILLGNSIGSVKYIKLDSILFTDLPKTNDVKVYPNPTNYSIHFEISNTSIDDIRISIYNALSLKVFEQIVEQQTEQVNFDVNVSGLAPGMYFYQINKGNEIMTGQVVILR